MQQKHGPDWHRLLQGPWLLWPLVDRTLQTNPAAAEALFRWLAAVPSDTAQRVRLSALPARVQRHAFLILLRYPQCFRQDKVHFLLKDYILDRVDAVLQTGVKVQRRTPGELCTDKPTKPLQSGQLGAWTDENVLRTSQSSTHRPQHAVANAAFVLEQPAGVPVAENPAYHDTVDTLLKRSGSANETSGDDTTILSDIHSRTALTRNDLGMPRQGRLRELSPAPLPLPLTMPRWIAARCAACQSCLHDRMGEAFADDPYMKILWEQCWTRFGEPPDSEMHQGKRIKVAEAVPLSTEAHAPPPASRTSNEGEDVSPGSPHVVADQGALRAPCSPNMRGEDAQQVLEWLRKLREDDLGSKEPSPPLAIDRLRTAADWEILDAQSASSVDLLYCLETMLKLPERVSVCCIESGTRTFLLRLVRQLKQPAPRSVLGVVRSLQRQCPRILLEQLLYPLLTCSATCQGPSVACLQPLGAPQAELCVQILEGDWEPAFRREMLHELLERQLCEPWTEHTLQVLECSLKRLQPAVLDSNVGARLAQALEAHANAPTLQRAGLRFAKLVHLLLNRYPAVVAEQRLVLIAALQQAPASFLRESALRKLQAPT
jgi:hypothetical protein